MNTDLVPAARTPLEKATPQQSVGNLDVAAAGPLVLDGAGLLDPTAAMPTLEAIGSSKLARFTDDGLAVEERVAALLETKQRYEQATVTKRKILHQLLEGVYRIHLRASAHPEEMDEIEKLCLARGVKVKGDHKHLRALLKMLLDCDHASASRNAQALRWAVINCVRPELLSDFLDAHEGGVTTCAAAYRAEQKRRGASEMTAAINVPSHTGPPKKRFMPKVAWAEPACRQYNSVCERAQQAEQPVAVLLRAIVGPDGIVTFEEFLED